MNKLLYITSKQSVFKTRSKQSGFSLIEVMVAALILSIGVLGVVSLQVIGLKGTHQSYMKQQAMLIVQDLTERMHANKQGVVDGSYVIDSLINTTVCNALTKTCDSATSSCSSADIAQVDLHTVVCGYQKGSAPRTGGVKIVSDGDISSLFKGQLQVACTDASGCSKGDIRISIGWTERELGKETATTDSILLNTRIKP